MTETFVTAKRSSPAYEDFGIGGTYITYAKTITETHLVWFTSMAGLNLPMFINHSGNSRGEAPGPRAIPGFLCLSLSAGMVEAVLGENVLAGLEIQNLLFRKFVVVGDTIHAKVHVKNKRECRDLSKGILSLEVSLLNQAQEAVVTYETKILILREGGKRDRIS